MIINSNVQNQQIQKPSVGAVIGGVLAGSTVSGMCNRVPKKLCYPKLLDKMQGLSNELTIDEVSKVKNGIADAFKASGLKSKGVKIVSTTSRNSKKIVNMLCKEFDNSIVMKYMPKSAKAFVAKNFMNVIKEGNNAAYLSACKRIVRPKKSFVLLTFHEMGHAMNANFSKMGKVLQKCRGLSLLSVPIALIALLKTKKAPGQEPQGAIDKTTTFIKDNAGKLTFAMCLPALIEEGMATLKGNKLAKKFLSPDLAKKVAKSNALGFVSYLGAATFAGLGIYLGTKVKDAIAKNKAVA